MPYYDVFNEEICISVNMSVSIAMRVVYVFVCLFLVMYYKYLFIIYNNIYTKIDESKTFWTFYFAKLIIILYNNQNKGIFSILKY